MSEPMLQGKSHDITKQLVWQGPGKVNVTGSDQR